MPHRAVFKYGGRAYILKIKKKNSDQQWCTLRAGRLDIAVGVCVCCGWTLLEGVSQRP